MIHFSASQLEEIQLLQSLCAKHGAEMVLIGAQAYLLLFDNPLRFTNDVDLVISLDLEDFPDFSRELSQNGWRQDENLEHRWRATGGNIYDLLPAGPRLRAQGAIIWPRSNFSMNLKGFDHVFSDFFESNAAPELKSIPAKVLALLKIVAFMDRPDQRRKDLKDFREIAERYEAETVRMFSAEVQAAELGDFSLGSAFLLGADLQELCNADEMHIVMRFLELIENENNRYWSDFAWPQGSMSWHNICDKNWANQILAAFRNGLSHARS